MAADGITVKVLGIKELRDALMSIPAEFRRGEMLRALKEGGKIVQRAARAATPTLRMPSRYRTAGLVKRKISVRVSKMARQQGNIGVFINVRPAKGGDRGAKSRKDPFYWRWLEFGWKPAGRNTGGSRASAGKRYRRNINKAEVAKIRAGWHMLSEGGKQLPQALGAITAYFKTAMTRMSARLAAKARRLSR